MAGRGVVKGSSIPITGRDLKREPVVGAAIMESPGSNSKKAMI
jgi:hypothetical protein